MTATRQTIPIRTKCLTNNTHEVKGRKEGKKRGTSLHDCSTGRNSNTSEWDTRWDKVRQTIEKHKSEQKEQQECSVILSIISTCLLIHQSPMGRDEPQPFQIWGLSLVRLSVVLPPASTYWTLIRCPRHRVKRRLSQGGCWGDEERSSSTPWDCTTPSSLENEQINQTLWDQIGRERGDSGNERHEEEEKDKERLAEWLHRHHSLRCEENQGREQWK